MKSHDPACHAGRHRRRFRWARHVPLVFVLGMPACATVDPTPDYDRATSAIAGVTGVEDIRPPTDPEVLEVDALLVDGLKVDDAVRIALLKSPALHEQFARIGVARADWVQSGLLQNPTLGMAILLPEGGGRSLIEGAVAQQIADLWRIPLRREAAEHEVDAAVLETARTAGRIAERVREAYYQTIAAEERVALSEADLDLVRQAHEATQRAQEIGRSTELEVRLARLRVLNTRSDLEQTREAAERARQELAYTMSLDRSLDRVELTSDWPAWEEPNEAEYLIAMARERRPDLQAVSQLAEAEGVRIALERRRTLPGLALGAQLERPGDTNLRLGPSVSTEIPIFDQNQAQIARAQYAQVLADSSYQQLHLRIGHEVRQASQAVRRSAERMTRYADQAVAEARLSVEQAERAHEAGHIDRLTLFETRHAHVEALRAHLAAQLDVARELIALESALGGVQR